MTAEGGCSQGAKPSSVIGGDPALRQLLSAFGLGHTAELFHADGHTLDNLSTWPDLASFMMLMPCRGIPGPWQRALFLCLTDPVARAEKLTSTGKCKPASAEPIVSSEPSAGSIVARGSTASMSSASGSGCLLEIAARLPDAPPSKLSQLPFPLPRPRLTGVARSPACHAAPEIDAGCPPGSTTRFQIDPAPRWEGAGVVRKGHS